MYRGGRGSRRDDSPRGDGGWGSRYTGDRREGQDRRDGGPWAGRGRRPDPVRGSGSSRDRRWGDDRRSAERGARDDRRGQGCGRWDDRGDRARRDGGRGRGEDRYESRRDGGRREGRTGAGRHDDRGGRGARDWRDERRTGHGRDDRWRTAGSEREDRNGLRRPRDAGAGGDRDDRRRGSSGRPARDDRWGRSGEGRGGSRGYSAGRGGDRRGGRDGSRSGRADRPGRRSWQDDRGDRRRDDDRVRRDDRVAPPGLERPDDEPEVSLDFDERLLPRAVRAELRGLPLDLAREVMAHLIAAGELIDEDPALANRHARAARRRAARLPVIREASAEAAYAAEDYATALTEYRAVARMTGSDEYLPVIADCERAMGRHDQALRTIRQGHAAPLGAAQHVELVLVEAGLRHDVGQDEEALRVLRRAIEAKLGRPSSQARLRYAYADILAQRGDVHHAVTWFTAAGRLDGEHALDVADRLEALGAEVPDAFRPPIDETDEDLYVEEQEPEDVRPEDGRTTGAGDSERPSEEAPDPREGDEPDGSRPVGAVIPVDATALGGPVVDGPDVAVAGGGGAADPSGRDDAGAGLGGTGPTDEDGAGAPRPDEEDRPCAGEVVEVAVAGGDGAADPSGRDDAGAGPSDEAASEAVADDGETEENR